MLNKRLKSLILFLAISVTLLLVPSTGLAVPPPPGVSAKEYARYIPDRIQTPVHKKSLEDILHGRAALQAIGNRPLLVILIEFSDVSGASNDVYFENMMWGPRPSLQDYYTEVSYGAFTYVPGQVLDPGADNLAPFWYASGVTQAWAVTNFRAFAAIAISAADADFNFALYDVNLDGTVTNEELTIVIVYSGSYATGPWPHHYWTVNPVATGDGVNVEGEYSMVGENSPMSTSAHELGHDLNLPDLYDTGLDSEGIGNYGLMGTGAWCGPTHMTAWSKMQLGWLTPTIVTNSQYFTVRDVETNPEAYILYNPSYSTTEYFLVENRWRGTSYDNIPGLGGILPDQGINIYHIDDAQAVGWWTSGANNVNAVEERKGVDVECEDWPTSHVLNADDLDSQSNRGDAADLWDSSAYDFFDGSIPCNANFYINTPSGVDVRNFPVPSPAMTVYLSVPALPTLLDFGDAPDPSYPSRLASNGARHSGPKNFYFGTNVDYEVDSRQVNADVPFDDGLVGRTPITFYVENQSASYRFVNVLVDYNRDGDWNDPGEWVAPRNLVVGLSGYYSVQPNLPDNTWMRTTITDIPLANYVGSWPTVFNRGETEDYIFPIPTVPLTVPASSPWSTMALGFAGLAALLWRRRRQESLDKSS